MKIESVRTITEIIDAETGELLHIDNHFFHQNEAYLFLLRRRLYEYAYLKIGQPKYLCAVCRQPVVLLGKRTKRAHIVYFAHYKDSDDCPIKTRGKELSEDELNNLRYKGGESDYHIEIKHQISSALQTSHICHNSFSHIQEEERIASKLDFRSWAVPDIYAECGNLRINFEVQLSTIFLSTIIERDIFYRFHGIFILWIFAPGAINNDTISRKDIIWTNNGNLFIYDQVARERTEKTGELTLLCRWYELVDNNADNVRLVAGKYLTLSDLTFDSKTNTVYYVDVASDIEKRHPNFKKERTEMGQMELEALDEFRVLLDGCTPTKEEVVEGLKSGLYKPRWIKKGNYWGYAKYGHTIIPFIYNHAENFVKGFAIVRRNRKYGVINKFGEEIIEPQYKSYEILDKYIKFTNDVGAISIMAKGVPYLFKTTIDIDQQIANLVNDQCIDSINKKEIIDLLDKCSNKIFAIGTYEEGRRTRPDLYKAINLYRISADMGNTHALITLGFYYEHGKIVEQDYQKATEYYLKSAKQGNATAQWNLALCYEEGKGVEQDYKQAFKWLKQAAEQGHKQALNRLGIYYEKGLGLEKDPQKAVEYFLSSAERGYASAQYKLALCYEKGEGIEQDYSQAFGWLQAAAEQGNAPAQKKLGDYLDGTKDPQKAVGHYLYYAVHGDVSAQYKLALCYEKGEGIEHDCSQAFRWLQKAAKQGNIPAQNKLKDYLDETEYANKVKEWHEQESQRKRTKYLEKLKKEEGNKLCPLCGGSLIVRNGYRGHFYGCSNFPKCKYTEDIDWTLADG